MGKEEKDGVKLKEVKMGTASTIAKKRDGGPTEVGDKIKCKAGEVKIGGKVAEKAVGRLEEMVLGKGKYWPLS